MPQANDSCFQICRALEYSNEQRARFEKITGSGNTTIGIPALPGNNNTGLALCNLNNDPGGAMGSQEIYNVLNPYSNLPGQTADPVYYFYKNSAYSSCGCI